MNAGVFDTIVLGFMSSIGGGIVALNRYSLLILAFCALVAYCSTMWPLVLSNGDALGPVLLMAIRIGIFYWLCISFAALSLAAFQSFLTWGTAPSGGAFSAASFLKPSTLVDLGYTAARPLDEMLGRMSAWPGNWFVWAVLFLARSVIIAAFFFVALHLIMTILEFHLAVMIGTVLFPWGILAQTSFLCEFAVSWIVAGLIRVLLTGAIMSISIPLFQATTTLVTQPGQDPTSYGAGILAGVAGVFAILAWQLPKRAAQVGGRGMALAMGGELLAHGAQTAFMGARAAMTGGAAMVQIGMQAAQGGSRMLRAARGGP